MSDALTDAREQFDRQAASYAVSVPHSSGDSLRILTELASLGRYESALDLATGPGFTAFAVAEFCNVVVASDIADGMLDQARTIASERGIENLRFEIVDAHDIPYDDGDFDLVTCRTAAHHFRDIDKFLSEVRRVLSASGTFLFCDTTTSENPDLAEWHQRVEYLRDRSHIRAPAPSEWRQRMTHSGFDITHEQATRVEMTFWHWVERSATPDDVARDLHRDFTDAPDTIKNEYGIKQLDDNDFAFHWPVIVCRAVKSSGDR